MCSMVSQGIVALFLKLWFVALAGGTVAGIGVIGASLFSPPVVLPLVSGKCVRVVFFTFWERKTAPCGLVYDKIRPCT